jgi:hypothetical protein
MIITTGSLGFYNARILLVVSLLIVSTALKSQFEVLASDAVVKEAVEDYYRHIKLYDHEAMRAAVTPKFELIYSRGRVDSVEFEVRHRAEVEELGPTESRPGRMDYQNVDFEIEIDGDVAYSRSYNINPAGKDNLDFFVLHRVDKKWLIHRFFHMPAAEAAE